MKTTLRLAITSVCLGLCACGGGGGGGSDSGGSGTRELALRQTATGSLKDAGQVDWYHYRAVEANNVLQVRCSSNTYRPDEELSVAVYEQDASGNRVLLYGDHAVAGSQVPADLKMNLYLAAPKDLYIAVRDYQDDEASGKPYYLTIDFAGQPDGDQSFSTAVALSVGAAPVSGVIGSIGDVDCYRFEVPQLGVYALDVDFSPFQGGTEVALEVGLYNADGDKVQTLASGRQSHARLLALLSAGTYYAMVEDQGRDDFDLSSSYGISVEAVPTAEVDQDDDQARAAAAATDPATGALVASGALGYRGDRDWYRLPMGQTPAVGIGVFDLTFAAPTAPAGVKYRLDLLNGAGTTLFSHELTPAAAAYRTEIRAGSGDHFVRVQEAQGTLVSQAAPYSVLVSVLDVSDPGEGGAGNDTIDTAQLLAPSPAAWTQGKIAYRGDEDWFAVQATTDAPRILEVYLETDGPSLADLSLTVLRDDILRKIYDADGGDGPTRLRTSLYVPAGSPAGPVTYFFRVVDAQGDEGDPAVPYRIRCNVVDVPASLPADAAAADALYSDEVQEQLSAESPVKLELSSLLKKQHRPNTSLLRFNGSSPAAGVTRTVEGGATTVTFPWIGGYIDYQGDQDWFELELEALDLGTLPLDPQWHYDIRVEFHVGAPGSPVEYVWKLYRDPNRNRILVDQPGDSNGFFGAGGDTTTAVDALDQTVPQPGTSQEFWVGDQWAGRFYLSVSDFDFVDAPLPDDDWGYAGAPYFFRLTLVYRPGASYP